MKTAGWLLLILVGFSPLYGQTIEIRLGADQVTGSEPWTISIIARNEELKTHDNFPNLKGFRKGTPSARSYTSWVNGAVESFQSVTMSYYPTRTGVIDVPSFSMRVNSSLVRVKGKKVTVLPGANAQRQGPYRRPGDADQSEPLYIDTKEDAFFALTTNKEEVYLGEGVNATLAFYIGENERASIHFHEISKQLTEILKKLKPTNCWEENFDIENVEGTRVYMNGREYIQFKIYQAVYFPLNTETINFPSVELEMLKPRKARNPSYYAPNTQEAYKTYHTKPVKVKVKPLPPHPLRNTVAVGEFRLEERLADTNLQTGQSAAYQFTIHGEGNIASIEKPLTKADGVFDIYDPSVNQEVFRKFSRVTGSKSFRYFMIPREPGQFKLAPYFQWIYFSPNRNRYDTLSSALTVFVTGESKQNETIEAHDAGSFYDRISITDNTLRRTGNHGWFRWAFGGFMVLMAGASVFLLLRK